MLTGDLAMTGILGEGPVDQTRQGIIQPDLKRDPPILLESSQIYEGIHINITRMYPLYCDIYYYDGRLCRKRRKSHEKS